MHVASFVHGFRLPFELFASILRDATLRGPYLRLFFVRAAIVAGLFVFPALGGEFSKEHSTDPHVTVTKNKSARQAVHLDLPGFRLDIDPAKDAGTANVLGRNVPIDMHDETPAVEEPEPEPDTPLTRMAHRAQSGWKWVLAAVAFLSIVEATVVFFSRRWDDWISHYGARLAGIVPEDADTKPRKLVMDLRWLYRKGKRKIRGYLQFGVGLPLLLPLQAIPHVGNYVFGAFASLWGWYWLGVFTAGKSAHAWGDPEPAPVPVRVFIMYVPNRIYTAPVRWYGRAVHWATRDSHAAANTFERNPAAFLGLGLARFLLAAPGLYLLARPIVPLAAGRLCAEVDPERRYWATDTP